LHAIYNLHIVDSYRSSSDSPNFQNIPKHDAEVASLLRMLLGPRPGRVLGEYDYKAIEVCVIACYNKDPRLIEYINNPSTDMHRDMAAKLFLRPKKDITDDERYGAKNGFVFPTFYGSYYKNTGKYLWENAKPETIAHLRQKGIKNLLDFTEHVKKVEHVFWNDQFSVGYEWMEKTIADFHQRGFMDSYTGFRYYGPLSNNQILNYRVQGSAFHCLLWTLDKVADEVEKKGMGTIMVGQIHDAMYPDFPPEEEEELDRIIWEYGTQKIKDHWPWIIVPLNIEKSRSAVDGNWADMQKVGLLKGE
jgi:DNA polymerase I-like protein with 3'-5' exonuclease and polymerase domains